MQLHAKLFTLRLVSLHAHPSAVVWHRRKVDFVGRLDSAQLIPSSNCKRSANCAAVTGSGVSSPGAYEAQMSDSDQVLRLFKGLSITDDEQIHVTNLAELEQHLQNWLATEGTSMIGFKKLLRNHAICLGNFTAYHSQKALKQALRTDPSLIVSRKKAKKYKLVKQCLTIL